MIGRFRLHPEPSFAVDLRNGLLVVYLESGRLRGFVGDANAISDVPGSCILSFEQDVFDEIIGSMGIIA